MSLRGVCTDCGAAIWRTTPKARCRPCYEGERAGTWIKCDHCRKRFYRQPAQQIYERNYCSHACVIAWRRKHPLRRPHKHKTFSCVECGTSATNFKSRLAGKKKLFCSQRCKAVWQAKNLRGTKAAGYIDGRLPFRKALKKLFEFSEWRLGVFERDDWTCQECGSEKALHAHHVIPFSQLLGDFKHAHPKLNYRTQKSKALRLAKAFAPFWKISIGQTLCKPCHQEQHPELCLHGGYRRKPFEVTP